MTVEMIQSILGRYALMLFGVWVFVSLIGLLFLWCGNRLKKPKERRIAKIFISVFVFCATFHLCGVVTDQCTTKLFELMAK